MVIGKKSLPGKGMPHSIQPPNNPFPPSGLPCVRWTIEQYENLITMGLLPEGGYELIEGDIVDKLPVKHPHALVITRLFAVFSRLSRASSRCLAIPGKTRYNQDVGKRNANGFSSSGLYQTPKLRIKRPLGEIFGAN